MTGRFELVIPGPPRGKLRARHGRGRTWTPAATVAAEDEIRAVWMESGRPRLDGPVAVDVRLVVAQPRAHLTGRGGLSAKGRRHALPDSRKPDVDNALKLVLDALNGCAWADDVQVVEARVAREWGGAPCTRIVGWSLGAPAALDDEPGANGRVGGIVGAHVPFARSTARDRAAERRFLAAAAPGRVAFAEQASDRLELGQTLYGDDWTHRSVRELVREMVEEASDLAAWGALALDAQSPRERVRIGALLSLSVGYAGQAREGLTLALSALTEAGR